MSMAPPQQALIFDRTGGAKERLLSRRGEPLFYANWDNVLFIHYEIEPNELQRSIPYPLDLYHGRAFVSLVAFTIRGMRPRLAGTLFPPSRGTERAPGGATRSQTLERAYRTLRLIGDGLAGV